MKAYIKPTIEIAQVETQHLMENSLTSVSDLEDVTVSTEDFPGGDADSRQRSVWDDEEMEEEEW